MTLVDTSVWVEFLRGTPGPSTTFVREQVGIGLATTEPIAMELLAGSRPGERAARVERLLLAQRWHHLDAGLDFRGAVDVFWAARSAGRQPRGLADCVIAAVALRCGVPVATRDADLVHIGLAAGLDVVDLR